MRKTVKRTLKLIDEHFLFSILNKVRALFLTRGLDRTLYAYSGRSFSVYPSGATVFADLCDRFGTDKGSNGLKEYSFQWSPHRYSDFYEILFGQCRNQVTQILEVGIGTGNLNLPANMGIGAQPGASLRVWREYFPNALIYGADIDSQIMFSEDRISTFLVDQLDEKSIQNAVSGFYPGTFDLIVDDGLHTFKANTTFFKNSIHLLSERGVYIIEDVTPANLKKLLTLRNEFFAFDFSPVTFHESNQMHELNSILMITRKSAPNSESEKDDPSTR
jgi:hypothetical protein